MKPSVEDLNALFMRYIAAKAAQEEDPMALENQMAELYETWLQTPNQQLGGVAPQHFFDGATDEELIELLADYVNARIEPPDPLLDSVVDAGPAKALLGMLETAAERTESTEGAAKLRILAVELLNQMGCTEALPAFITLILEHSDDALLLAVSQAVAALGEEALPALKSAVPGAPDAALPILLDLISAQETSDEVYEQIESAFIASPARIYLYAPLLARFESPRAVGALQKALTREVGYLDYLSLRDALEALGEIVEERDFSGDPDYEKMKVY